MFSSHHGGLIGRIFECRETVCFGQFLEQIEVCSRNFGANYDKMGWATFWAIFFKTHLVTLLPIFSSERSVSIEKHLFSYCHEKQHPPSCKKCNFKSFQNLKNIIISGIQSNREY
jgi:hypothetical protein